MRWVIWTLAAHERKHPELYLGKLLSKSNVMLAVLHRYGVYERGMSNHLQYNCSTLTPNKVRFFHAIDSPNSVAEPSSCGKLIYGSAERSQKLKFSIKSGGMSPLQRATDIRTLTRPIIVCLSICGGKSSNGRENSAFPKPESDEIEAEITDGWWWSRAKLDRSLYGYVASVRVVDLLFNIMFPVF
jgi:hypothetical protein